ncbi:MAG: class I SAM-dependent methyltransferase [Acidobacteriia bacterium]|nr:class I SAM-dependent methyltransferase [Terriglobia bacterium]MBV8904884.1 class I SAM-dependent methyltransferase [Terriglobia bacterium]
MQTNQSETIKTAVRRFWGTRPCGVTHSAAPAGSPEFFRETEAHRFRIHTDWDHPFLKEAVGFRKYTGNKVLEVGCGIGVDALEWAKSGNSVVALDYNLPSCQLTRGRFEDASAQGVYINGDAENLPFPDASFDIVYSFGVLHHTPGTQGAIGEIHRCLKRGGIAIVMLYYKWSAMVWGEVMWGSGVRQGGFRKTGSMRQVLSRYTEWDSQCAGNVNPLTKAYSKREIRKMFQEFRHVQIDLHYLWPGHFGPLRRLLPFLPAAWKQRFPALFGFNAVIEATK